MKSPAKTAYWITQHILRRSVTFVPHPDDLERLQAIARHRNSDVWSVLCDALEQGTKIQETKDLEDQLLSLKRARDQLLEKRDKLAIMFGKLSAADSTLRHQYFDLYSQNKSLTLNLCGHGMGERFPELLDRYLFANNEHQKASGASKIHSQTS
jgi:hypothetical protein